MRDEHKGSADELAYYTMKATRGVENVAVWVFAAGVGVIGLYLTFLALKWSLIHWRGVLTSLAFIGAYVTYCIWKWDGK